MKKTDRADAVRATKAAVLKGGLSDWSWSSRARACAWCRLLAQHDRPPFTARPSLAGHCGHGSTCSSPRLAVNDPSRTCNSRSLWRTPDPRCG